MKAIVTHSKARSLSFNSKNLKKRSKLASTGKRVARLDIFGQDIEPRLRDK